MAVRSYFQLSPVLRGVLAALIIANVASEMTYTILPIHLLHLGATTAQVGLVFTGGMVFISLLQFFGGWISDRIGRLRAIAIGSIIATLGYIGFYLSPSWIWILPSICLEFVSIALVGPSFSALIADMSAPESRGRTFALMRGTLLTVTVIAPFLGGYLAQTRDFHFVLGLSVVMYFSASLLRIWLVWRFPAPAKTPAEAHALPSLSATFRGIVALAFGGGLLTWIMITDGGRDLAFNLSSDLLPVYLTTALSMTVVQVGLFRSIRGWASVAGTFGSGWLIDRLGERKVIVMGFLLEAVGLLLLVQAHTLQTLIPAAVLFGTGMGMLFPAFDSLIAWAIPPAMRGSAYGLFDSNRNLLAMPGPLVGGELMQHFFPSLPFLITAALNTICAILAWFKLHLGATPDPEKASEAGA